MRLSKLREAWKTEVYDADLSGYFDTIPHDKLISAIRTRVVEGWARYYAYGYPAQAYREINRYARARMTIHLKRRSQRKYKTANGKSYYEELSNLGLVYLK